MAATIDGREYQHATIDLQSMGGVGLPFQFNFFSKVAWKQEAEKSPVLDAKGQVRGYTIGNAKNSGSITTLLSEWIRYREAMEQQFAPLRIGQIAVDMKITYGNSVATLKEVTLYGVMFNSDGVDSSNNQEALPVEIPLFFVKRDPPFINYDAPVT